MGAQASDSERLAIVVEEMLDMEIDRFPPTISTVFGQQLPIVSADGSWCDDLRFEHIGYKESWIPWGRRLHESDYIEWIVRAWTIERVQTRLDVRPVTQILKRIDSLHVHSVEPLQAEEALFRWLQDIATTEAVAGRDSAVIGARLLYQWCLEEDLPGFSEFRFMDFESISMARRDTDHLVSMRDTTNGPYTRVELGIVEAALRRSGLATVAQRALFLLGRDWGLRPIQMALLRPEDHGRDELGPYVMVPSVKGVRRSRRRRSKGNLVKRYIADDTSEAIEAQMVAANHQAAIVLDRCQRILGERRNDYKMVIPLFPCRERSEARLRRMLGSPALMDYSIHADSSYLSKLLRTLTWQLAIVNGRSRRDELLEISAYRLRRTKGTSMVLSGATPEEVAEALDHQSISTIVHYFRYNRELHDFINQVHASSPDIATAARMWEGRFSDDTKTDSGDGVIGGLGRCKRGSPCPYHPTVSCYACHRFRPSRNGDHLAALKSIEAFQLRMASESTGPIAQQLEAAIFGAKAVILAVEEQRDGSYQS